MKKKFFKILLCSVITVLLVTVFSVTAFAAGDVSGAIEQTWTTAQSQIRSVVDKVVFPVVDTILAILFFVKLGTAYFDYRKHGQFEFTAPAILFACLIFTLTAPMYIWSILYEFLRKRNAHNVRRYRHYYGRKLLRKDNARKT